MTAPRRSADARRLLTRRGFVGGTAATAAALGLAGRASAAPARVASLTRAGFQADDSVILIGTLGEASTINPFLESDSEAYWRCKLMFEQFVRVDGATYAPTPGPGIAEDWTLEDLTYTFKINPKATRPRNCIAVFEQIYEHCRRGRLHRWNRRQRFRSRSR
jgi:ABC-type transport system substrate-binding protein